MIPTIIDYKIITFQPKLGKASPDKLAELVKDQMKQGWSPFGGIQSNNAVLYQAMVKYQ